MLSRGYTQSSLPWLGDTSFWHDFTPFWHVAVWCAPDWAKNTAGWRLFQLVVVVARRKDYGPHRNGQRPRPAQTWSAYILTWSAYHRAWFGDFCIPWWVMMSPGSCVTPVSWSRAAPSAPKFKNADTDTWRGQLCTSRATCVAFRKPNEPFYFEHHNTDDISLSMRILCFGFQHQPRNFLLAIA